MRYFIFVMLLAFSWSNGQFFENNAEDYDYSQFESENGEKYQESNGFFSGTGQESYLRDDDDNPTNPGELPIDDGWFLLPLAGIAIGFYYLRKRNRNLV